MKLLCCFIGLLFLQAPLLSQDIGLKDLEFQNNFEEQAISNFKTENNHLAVLLASSGKCDSKTYNEYVTRLDEVYEELNPIKLVHKKPKKQVKKVFNTVHDNLLKKYQLNNNFIEVFESGNFNCVSATALYALMLNKLGIDYVIQEEPEHVYLVALFKDKQILIEGTNPQKGYVSLTDKYRETQLSALLSMKLISEEDLNSPEKLRAALEELYPSTEISFKQLLGVQYHNRALYAIDKEDYKSAYNNALKAYYFYPHDAFKYIIYMSLAELLDKTDYLDSSYVPYLSMYSRLDTGKEHYSSLTTSFSYITYELLNEKHDVSALNQFYAQFKKQVKVESVQAECAFHYALYKADYYAKLGELDSSYFFSRKAIGLNPKDLDATSQFISALFKSIDLKRFENGSDSAVFYYQAYESLRSNKLYCSAYAAVMLQSAYKDINAKNYKKARKTLDKFDEFAHATPGLLFDPDQVGLIYSKIALLEYNFNKSRALKTIRSGLLLAPGHYDLLKVQSFMR